MIQSQQNVHIWLLGYVYQHIVQIICMFINCFLTTHAVTERGMIKTPINILDLFISTFSSISFVFSFGLSYLVLINV